MKKNDKERLFEVMGRLDKTFKPPLNENNQLNYVSIWFNDKQGNAIDGEIKIPASEYDRLSDDEIIVRNDVGELLKSQGLTYNDVGEIHNERINESGGRALNEGIGDMEADGMPDTGQAPDLQDMPAPEAMPDEEGVEEKSPEEKLADLTAKVDEMYAMLHGEEEVPAEEPEEIEVTTGEVDAENLQEWNFDKKKGEKEEGKEHEEKEEEKEEVDEDVNITVTEKKGKALSAEKAPEVEIGK